MTGFAFEIVLHTRSPEAVAWFDQMLVPVLTASEQAGEVAIFHPAEGEASDPHIDDGAPWPRLAMLTFATERDWLAFAAQQPLLEALARRGASLELTGSGFERIVHPVAQRQASSRRGALFSYVVRYSGLDDGLEAFREDYLKTHHILLGRLPGIRSLVNFLPVGDMTLPQLPGTPYGLGNEVTFDDLAAFNAAMNSPERHALRRAFLAGPKAPASTHFPMLRTPVFVRAGSLL